MVMNDRPTKRPRRRVTADLPDFFTFPHPENDDLPPQPFRESVRRFLIRHAHVTCPSSSLFPSLVTSQISLQVGNLGDPATVLPLDVVEEDVTRSRRSVYCDQCRVVGWSGHPVCKKRYHFIIRRGSETCDGESLLQNGFNNHQKWCSSIGATTMEEDTDDAEEWAYRQLQDTSHLLHAVIHSNGFAHLLTLNGRQGGSTILSGRHILDFWDRLCQTLSVRKVSVMDLSKKYGMEYRLLHTVTKGRCWYGDWGYEFGAGSYALTQHSYHKAAETLSTLPLHPFQFQPRAPRTRLQSVIAFYQSLSDAQLVTIKDLFTHMLSLTHRARKSTSPNKPEQHHTSNALCVWTANDVEHVQQAMIKLLLASVPVGVGEGCWVLKRALRGALCKSSSPELLDYCLKHLGGKLTPNDMVVKARCSPASIDVEYRLEPLSDQNVDGSELDSSFPSEDQILCDLKYLYDSILHPDTMLSYKPRVMREQVIDAATKLLDCKKFVKEYRPDKMAEESSHGIQLWCHVELSDEPKDDLVLPPELIVLPWNATVADLKREATTAFQEVYAMFKRFETEELLHYGAINDSLTVKLLFGSCGSICVKGKCTAKHGLSRFRMERGLESWTVDCQCGAKDDDGERMLACDTCGVWQHTRCAGIHSSDEIPAKFVCMRCVSSYRKKTQNTDDHDHHPAKGAKKRVSFNTTTCRAKAAAAEGPSVASDMNMAFGVR